MRLNFYPTNNFYALPKQLLLLLLIAFSWSLWSPSAQAQRLIGGLDITAALNLNVNVCGPQLSISSNLPSCEGNTVCLAIVGGVPPYKVLVDGQSHTGSLLGLAVCIQKMHPGSHIIKVIDVLGCESTLNINIPSLNDLLKPVIKPVTCHGGSNGAISIDLSLLVGINISNLVCRWEGPGNYHGQGREIHDLRPGRYTVTILAVGNICIGTSAWEVPQPEPIKINVNIVNAACGTANACAYISGGKAPYRIWGFHSLPGTGNVTNTNFLDYVHPETHRDEDCTRYNPETNPGPFCVNNLSAGYYYILVQDANGCYAWQVFKINPNAHFQRTLDVHDISCAGDQDGKICFDIIGNTPPYKTTLAKADGYTIHTIEGIWGCFENLHAGDYLLITTDGSGCTSKEQIKIMEPEELEAVFVLEENNCRDGAKGCLKINGGTRPYQVSAWFYPNSNNDTYEIGYRQDGTPYVLNAERCNYFNFPPVWSPTNDFCVRNLPPGKYILLVVDAHHCYEKIVVHVPTLEDLQAKFELNSGSCDEWGNGCLTIEGGTQPYKVFVWSSPNLLNIIPTVQFDANGNPHITACSPTNWQWSTPGIAPPYQICASEIPPGYYWILIVDKNGCYKLLQVNVPHANKIYLNAQVKNVSCNGEKDGKVFLKITGGSEPYIIQINGVQSNSINLDNQTIVLDSLKAGIYKIEVTDKNGCTAVIEVKITEPEPLYAVFISDQQDVCSSETGGCVTVQGGTAPYRVRLWQPDEPGNINVTVHFNVITNHFEIQGAFELNLQLPSPNNNNWCFNYIPPGDYLILVTDANGCYTLIPIHIAEPNNLHLNAEVFHSACNAVGGKVKLRIKGGEAPYQIQFGDRSLTTSDSIVWLENVPPGTYQIYVTDKRSCNAEIKVVVKTEEIQSNLHFDKFGEWACVNPSGGTAPYKIEWTNLETGAAISNDSCVYNLHPGVYQVTIYDHSGCSIQHWFVVDPQPCDAGMVKLSKEWIHSGESIQFKLVGHQAVSIQWQFRTQFTEWIDIPGATSDVFLTPPLHVAMDEVIYVRAKVKCANGGIAYTEEASFKVAGNPLLNPIDRRIAHPQLFNREFRQAELQLLEQDKTTPVSTLVYPTISRDLVKVRFSESSEEPVKIYLLNSLGVMFYQMQQDQIYKGEEVEVPVNGFAPGTYFVRIENGQQSETQRIIVQ